MFHRFLLNSVALLLGCAFLVACGGGGSSNTGPDGDLDGDGVINSLDVDVDNNGLIEVASLEQLNWMRYDLEGTSRNDGAGNVDSTGCPVGGCNGYELVADLDFDTNGDGLMDVNDTYYSYDGAGTNTGWLPIGLTGARFAANFDGNGHTIANLYINRPTATNVGLFGALTSSGSTYTINNLKINGPLTRVTGNNFVGLLVGLAASANVNIDNVSVDGYVSANGAAVGGVLGYVFSSDLTLSNCSAAGTLDSSASASGGLVGRFGQGTIAYCTSTMNVTSTNNIVGGLVGIAELDSTITNSSASGTVTGVDNVGGLVGSAYKGKITRSHATGAVTGGNQVGGLIGILNSLVQVDACYATGDVTGTDAVAGLVGNSNFSAASSTPNNITGSFSTSKVTGVSYVGGLLGLSYHTLVYSSFATASVTGQQYVGGLVGDANTGTSIVKNFAAGFEGLTTGGNAATIGGLVGWNDGALYQSNYFASNVGVQNAIGTNNTTAGLVNPAGTTGVDLVDLQCPTTYDDTACLAGTNITLYTSWNDVVWDFGTSMELPGLSINGVVYRDANGDGVLDSP